MNFYGKIDLKNLSVCIKNPFFIFEHKNFLDLSQYKALDRAFPEKDLFPKRHEGRGDKAFLNNSTDEFASFVSGSPEWNAFFQNFTNKDCIDKFYKMSMDVDSERPPYQCKPWKLVTNSIFFRKQRFKYLRRMIGRLFGYTPVVLKLEFSYLENGCWIPPHTDDTRKLISLMVYFPDDNVEYGDSAGTEFYTGKDGKAAPTGWRAVMMYKPDADEFYKENETFYSSKFEGNKLVGFVKSSLSWHGLEELKLPEGATRRSLNVNYYLL